MKTHVRGYEKRDGTLVRSHDRSLSRSAPSTNRDTYRPPTRDFPNKSDLEGGLPIQFAVVIPSTKQADEKIAPSAFAKRVKDTKEFFTKKFGGTTTERAIGTYTDKNGRVIGEDVSVVEVFTNEETWDREDEAVKKWLQSKKKAWGQESLGFEYEGDLIFI